MRVLSLLAIAAVVTGTQAICFDNFDCFGKGFNCVKPKGKLLGQCKPKNKGKREAEAEAEALEIEFPLEQRDEILAERAERLSDELEAHLEARQGGGICFDNFDCFGKGLNCVKPKGKLLGKCGPKKQ